jgi:hypothetical protein
MKLPKVLYDLTQFGKFTLSLPIFKRHIGKALFISSQNPLSSNFDKILTTFMEDPKTDLCSYKGVKSGVTAKFVMIENE